MNLNLSIKCKIPPLFNGICAETVQLAIRSFNHTYGFAGFGFN